MTVSIARIENNTIINIIVGSDNWEKIFSRDSGYSPVEELTGEIVIGAIRSEDGSFATLQVEEPSTPQLP